MKYLTLSLLMGSALLASAQSANAPQILRSQLNDTRLFRGLSDNGKYAVTSVTPEESGFTYFIGAYVFDLTGSAPKATNIGTGHSMSAAMDVTDDGLTVVGSVDMMPAVCRNQGGKWVWEKLPLPDLTITLVPETSDDDNVIEVKINGGEAAAVTPDGKYAVGLVRSNEYELVEQAAMWDLTTGKLVTLPKAPNTGRDGIDYSQTRYTQISADGRYVLGRVAFSYSGDLNYVYDRQTDEVKYIGYDRNAQGFFTPRVSGYDGINMDGVSKALTPDGHYVTGSIGDDTGSYIFLYDVWKDDFQVFDNVRNKDVTAFAVTMDGIPLVSTPAVNPYCYGFVYLDDFLFSFEQLYRDVYGMNLDQLGIENTGKPTYVSNDGRTIVMITDPDAGYILRLNEDIRDAFAKVRLLDHWTASPAANSAITVFSSVTLTFDSEIETDASRYAEIRLLDSKGGTVASPLANGGLQVLDNKLILTFRGRQLTEGERYTLSIPAGICNVKGRPHDTNAEINISYVGRADVPVKVMSVSPEEGSSLASLDINDNPVVVTFDIPVVINGTADNRPIAHLHIVGTEEPVAPLSMDVDLYTGNLIIFPPSTVQLYKGADYVIKVPAGAVCDQSGRCASEAFEIRYTGSYTPQIGDERYVFRSTADDFSYFLVFEGDKGEPTREYADFGFTATTTPWWIVYDDDDVTNGIFASHSVYIDGRKANDWLVTRQLKIPESVPTYLSFQSQSYRKSKTDRLKVYIYENNGSLNLLTKNTIDAILEKGDLVYDEVQSPGATENVMRGEWRDNVIDLADYAGKNIYICFLNDNQNQSMVMIDNIEVVKEVKAFLSVTSPSNVVNESSASIKGIITVESDLVNYSDLAMTLSDADGKQISTLSAKGLSLTKGDTYNFEFPQKLPVKVGYENAYTITYVLDEDELTYEGAVFDLAFQPVKRVVVEEYTGKECQFCPQGMAAMERLVSLYGDNLIPVVLHAYEGDSKGMYIKDYANAVFMGVGTAPNGRINRRANLAAPMVVDANKKYHMSASEVPGTANLWLDDVAEEFREPTYLDISLRANEIASYNTVSYTATVKSAINVSDRNIRVLGILLEDNIIDDQLNGLANVSDPLLGEFGQGGLYGKSRFYYNFQNVARGYWGQGANGTPRLIPSTLEVGKEYEVDIVQSFPSGLNPANIKMAVILIDEGTGKVINAAVLQSINGVEEITADAASAVTIARSGSDVVVEGAADMQVTVYSLDGRKLAETYGNGSLSLPLEGYRGIAIVSVVAADGSSSSAKLLF